MKEVALARQCITWFLPIHPLNLLLNCLTKLGDCLGKISQTNNKTKWSNFKEKVLLYWAKKFPDQFVWVFFSETKE